MLNDIGRSALSTGRNSAGLAARMVIVPKDHAMGPIKKVMHRLVMMTGILAIGILALMFVRPELADRLKMISPFAASVFEEFQEGEENFVFALDLMPVVESDPTLQAQQERLAQWISRRYRVAGDATNLFVSTAYTTAQEMKFDPLLILAVIAIESRFNPLAESPVGAQGLMQVLTRVHQEKFEHHGGVKAALHPVSNIKVGTQILHDYIRRGGSVEAGLKRYVGAANMKTDQGYGAKVLGEYRRLKDVASGKRMPALTSPTIKQQDLVQSSAEPKQSNI